MNPSCLRLHHTIDVRSGRLDTAQLILIGRCDFLLLTDVNEWMSSECLGEGT
jgi:hypothetical protein